MPSNALSTSTAPALMLAPVLSASVAALLADELTILDCALERMHNGDMVDTDDIVECQRAAERIGRLQEMLRRYGDSPAVRQYHARTHGKQLLSTADGLEMTLCGW